MAVLLSTAIKFNTYTVSKLPYAKSSDADLWQSGAEETTYLMRSPYSLRCLERARHYSFVSPTEETTLAVKAKLALMARKISPDRSSQSQIVLLLLRNIVDYLLYSMQRSSNQLNIAAFIELRTANNQGTRTIGNYLGLRKLLAACALLMVTPWFKDDLTPAPTGMAPRKHKESRISNLSCFTAMYKP